MLGKKETEETRVTTKKGRVKSKKINKTMNEMWSELVCASSAALESKSVEQE